MKEPRAQTTLQVGDKIRRLRLGANLTLDELAERTGLPASKIEQIEMDMISPALGVLTRICDGLGVRLGSFFDRGPRKLYCVVRANDEKVGTRYAFKSGTDYGFEYQALGTEKRERVMEPFLITTMPPIDPNVRVELEEVTSHGGEEFIYVLEGEIEIQLQDQNIILKSGDSIYYDANVPHRILHHGNGPSRTLTVVHLPRKS